MTPTTENPADLPSAKATYDPKTDMWDVRFFDERYGEVTFQMYHCHWLAFRKLQNSLIHTEPL